jgi:hypothetical protein
MRDGEPSRKGAKNRTHEEWATLFDRHPPSGPRPSKTDIEALARRLGHSPDAIGWTWQDASNVLAGRPSTASERLKAYMRERGLIQARGRDGTGAAATMPRPT